MYELETLGKAIEYMRDKLDQIAEAIMGDPTDANKPGILIRLDRVERSCAGLKRALALLGGALVTVTATIIAAFVIKLV